MPCEPERLWIRLRDDALIFWEENQQVGLWGTLIDDLGEPDPPVHLFGRYEEGQRDRENEHLSQFITQMIIMETVVVGDGGGMGFREEEVSRLSRGFVPLGLPSWHYPAPSSLLHASDEGLILVCRDGGDVSVYLATRDDEALAAFTGSLEPELRERLHLEDD